MFYSEYDDLGGTSATERHPGTEDCDYEDLERFTTRRNLQVDREFQGLCELA